MKVLCSALLFLSCASAAIGQGMTFMVNDFGLVSIAASKIVHAQNRQRENAQSLVETEHWIENTFNEQNVGYYQILSADNTIDESYSVIFDGCTLGLETAKIHRYPSNGTRNEQQSSVIYYVNLKDIDPVSIKIYFYDVIGVRRAFVGLLTRDDENSITTIQFPNGIQNLVRPSAFPHEQHYVPEHASKGNSIPLDKTGIVMAADYAPRFIKAMRHATELCGGRRSMF